MPELPSHCSNCEDLSRYSPGQILTVRTRGRSGAKEVQAPPRLDLDCTYLGGLRRGHDPAAVPDAGVAGRRGAAGRVVPVGRVLVAAGGEGHVAEVVRAGVED